MRTLLCMCESQQQHQPSHIYNPRLPSSLPTVIRRGGDFTFSSFLLHQLVPLVPMFAFHSGGRGHKTTTTDDIVVQIGPCKQQQQQPPPPPRQQQQPPVFRPAKPQTIPNSMIIKRAAPGSQSQVRQLTWENCRIFFSNVWILQPVKVYALVNRPQMDFTLYDNHYIRRFEQIISTQNENSNSSNNSTIGSRKMRTPLTIEQREMINAKRRVSALTPEQRERRNSKRRITSLTPEQRERINAKRRVSSLTPEQREKRNSKRRVSALTQEQREKRNMKRRITSMSVEQRAIMNSKRRRTSGQHHLSSPQSSHKNLQQQQSLQPQEQFITSIHVEQPKQKHHHHHHHHQQNHHHQQPQHQNEQQFTSTIVAVASDPNHQITSYDLFRQKVVQYTPQEIELINSLRNSGLNINRRCWDWLPKFKSWFVTFFWFKEI